MLFVFYAQPLSLAAHTAGAALSSILKSLYPKLFVSLKKTKKILMEKKASQEVCSARDNGCA